MTRRIRTRIPPDGDAPGPGTTSVLRAYLLEALSSIRMDGIDGNLVDTGIVDRIEIHDGRAELALRPIQPVSRRAGDRTHQLWERVQERLEQADPPGARPSVRIDWDKPWSP